MARYNNVGCLIMKTKQNRFLKNILEVMDEIGCPYEELTPDAVRERMPAVSTASFDEPRRTDDPRFGEPLDRDVPVQCSSGAAATSPIRSSPVTTSRGQRRPGGRHSASMRK